MDIKFECPHCRQSLQMDEAGAGMQIFCPGCGQRLIVPHPVAPPVIANLVREPPAVYGSTPRESITKRLSEMDWFQFEKLMQMCYQTQGYKVTRRGGANPDGGIDLIVEKGGIQAAVQCKHWKSWRVGVRNIRELKGAMTIANIPSGIIVTLLGYSEEARTLGREQNIDLLDTGGLLDLIDRGNLRVNQDFLKNLYDDTKYCPKCETRLVLKTAEKGINRGNQFWACPRFPKCRYLINT